MLDIGPARLNSLQRHPVLVVEPGACLPECVAQGGRWDVAGQLRPQFFSRESQFERLAVEVDQFLLQLLQASAAEIELFVLPLQRPALFADFGREPSLGLGQPPPLEPGLGLASLAIGLQIGPQTLDLVLAVLEPGFGFLNSPFAVAHGRGKLLEILPARLLFGRGLRTLAAQFLPTGFDFGCPELDAPL
ncbi:MAG TPA: hypothetical protein VG433_13925, partial [Pirellulales bacterium]|nr:hypothetical protein [Pirellulales bacterium]